MEKDLQECIERLAACFGISFDECRDTLIQAADSFRRKQSKIPKCLQPIIKKDGICRGHRANYPMFDDFILPDNTIEALPRGGQLEEDSGAVDIFRPSASVRKRNRKTKAKKSPKRYF